MSTASLPATRPRSSRRRPGSSRRRPASAGRETILHGASRPRPDSGSPNSGPGVFRSFALHSKYNGVDPLGHGPTQLDPSCSPFALGQASDVTSRSEFRAIDISKVNAKRHRWAKIDTFQTPFGHTGDMEDVARTVKFECGFRAESLVELKQQLLVGIRQDIKLACQELGCALRLDMEKMLCQIAAPPVQEGTGSDDCIAAMRGELDTLKKHLLSAMEDGTKKVQAELSEVTEAIHRKNFNAEFTSVLGAIDAKTVSVGLSEVKTTTDDANFDKQLSALFEMISTNTIKVDMSELQEALRQKNFDAQFLEVTEGIRQLQFGTQLDQILQAIESCKAHTDVTGFKEAMNSFDTQFASVKLDLLEVRAAIMQQNFDARFLDLTETIRGYDFDNQFLQVLQAIGGCKAPVDFTEIKEVIRQKNFDAQFQSILHAIEAKTGEVDLKVREGLSEVKEAIHVKNFDAQFSSVMSALENRTAHIDFSEVDKSLCRPNFDAQLRELTESVCRLDIDKQFLHVRQSIEDYKAHMDFTGLKEAIRQKNFDAQFQSLWRAMSKVLEKLESCQARTESAFGALETVSVRASASLDCEQLWQKLAEAASSNQQLYARFREESEATAETMRAYHIELMMEFQKLAKALGAGGVAGNTRTVQQRIETSLSFQLMDSA
mmetsp:Transcript_25505/g.59257  ORF Transcript_25505/g.59257 Transcript_25505/m.59257 type:complete len:662 (-) Transcript_25505:119-2104(-)